MTSTHAAAAKMIRQELKRHGITATVRSESYSGGSSIRIHVQDHAPWTVNAIEGFVSKFEMGHFDGMTDCYDYSNCRDDLPQVKFVFVNNDISDELRQAAYDYLRANWAGYEDKPERYEDARNLRGCAEWVSDEVHRIISGRMGDFWKKPRIRVAA